MRRIPIRTKLALATALPLLALLVVTVVAVRATSDDRHDTVLVALAVATVGAALLLTRVVARSIIEPLRSLTAQAKDMAEHRLPEAVFDILDTPLGEDVRTPQVVPVTVAARDEVGDVVEALNTVQETALDLAVEQAMLRRNIADSFVNLGRRNQNLLGRQLDFITELESSETDPDTLAALFRLDHLATRMRRNAESLLVLAGIEPPRKWAAPVRLSDVIRAALGEVEDYQRVALRRVAPATVLGSAAADLAHLIAELVENALSFSPPDRLVEITGALSHSGYRLTVVDHGFGMKQADIERANRRLMGGESFTIAPSKYLGHYVAGNLAARHGVALRLDNAPGTGVAATIEVPASVLTTDAPLGDPITDPNIRTVVPGAPTRPPTPDAPPVARTAPTGSSAPPSGAAMPQAPAAPPAPAPWHAAVTPPGAPLPGAGPGTLASAPATPAPLPGAPHPGEPVPSGGPGALHAASGTPAPVPGAQAGTLPPAQASPSAPPAGAPASLAASAAPIPGTSLRGPARPPGATTPPMPGTAPTAPPTRARTSTPTPSGTAVQHSAAPAAAGTAAAGAPFAGAPPGAPPATPAAGPAPIGPHVPEVAALPEVRAPADRRHRTGVTGVPPVQLPGPEPAAAAADSRDATGAPDLASAGAGPDEPLPVVAGAGHGRAGRRSFAPLPGGPATTPRLQRGRTASGLAKRELRPEPADGDRPTPGGPGAGRVPGRSDGPARPEAQDALLADIARALPRLGGRTAPGGPVARRPQPADENGTDPTR